MHFEPNLVGKDVSVTLSRSPWSEVNPTQVTTWESRDILAVGWYVGGRAILYFIHLMTKSGAEEYFLNPPTESTTCELLRREEVGGRATIYFITFMTN